MQIKHNIIINKIWKIKKMIIKQSNRIKITTWKIAIKQSNPFKIPIKKITLNNHNNNIKIITQKIKIKISFKIKIKIFIQNNLKIYNNTNNFKIMMFLQYNLKINIIITKIYIYKNNNKMKL